jgi:SAM-dependent methyltransferase
MEAAVKPYPLDNQHPKSADHHASLTSLFDRYTQQRAQELTKLHGASCLEVGYGGGTFALWLAGEVGPHGTVLATDLEPREIPEHPRLTVLRHDIINEPVPGTYDLIHARLVLGHLPQQRQILTRLAEALKPGGVLFIEDWWTATPGDLVVHAPDEESAELYNYYSTMARKVFGAGTDRNWPRRIHGAMMDDGLVDVHTDIHAEAWAGGSAGCKLLQATMPQVRGKLLEAGLTDDVFERVRALLDDPRLVLTGHLMCSTSGHKPS